MRAVFATLLLTAALAAQGLDQASPMRLARELRTAIQDDSLISAAEIATRLDDAVQAQRGAWLVRDSRERVDEVLSWLPPDTESLWVNQEPFTVHEEAVELLYGRPAQQYSLDRLMALNDGRFYRSLDGRTLRLVVAATRGIGRQSTFGGTPGLMALRDVAYFYFATEPLDFGRPDESLAGRPVWRASAMVDGGEMPGPGVKRTQREDANWLALARPDLLILANRKDLLSEILARISGGYKTRALPAALPEWTQVDRGAPFWGLRHYTDGSRPKPGERGCEAAELPEPDCKATGVTVRFDTAQQRLEIRYLSETPLAQYAPFGDDQRREFQVDRPQAGVWRLVSDVQKRGPYPVGFAFSMLGFGMYR